MLHGHENSVEDNADGDAEVNEWIHDDGIKTVFEPSPTATTVPLQEDVGEGVPARGTRSLIVFKVWEHNNSKVKLFRTVVLRVFMYV